MLLMDVLNEIKAILCGGKGFDFGDHVSVHFNSILKHMPPVQLGT